MTDRPDPARPDRPDAPCATAGRRPGGPDRHGAPPPPARPAAPPSPRGAGPARRRRLPRGYGDASGRPRGPGAVRPRGAGGGRRRRPVVARGPRRGRGARQPAAPHRRRPVRCPRRRARRLGPGRPRAGPRRGHAAGWQRERPRRGKGQGQGNRGRGNGTQVGPQAPACRATPPTRHHRQRDGAGVGRARRRAPRRVHDHRHRDPHRDGGADGAGHRLHPGESLTVESSDGFTATYTLDGGVGDDARRYRPRDRVQVRVVAAKDGMKVTRLRRRLTPARRR